MNLAHNLRLARVCLVLLLSVIMLGAGVTAADARGHANWPILALGNSGADVVALQHLLRDGGFGLAVSGTFDAATQAAVAETQATRGLKVDGVVDAATWPALLVPLAAGDRREAVRAVQHLLNAKRAADLLESGSFDEPTAAAVTAFQRRADLPRSGNVDTATWRSLLAHYVRASRSDGILCHYHSGNGHVAKWGTASTIGQLEAAAAAFHARTGRRVSVGEISFIRGGNIRHHATHEIGLDVDLGLVRLDGRHCRRLGLSYRQAQYDRDATRELIRAIYAAAPGMVKLIYFNDPVLIREGLVKGYPRHDDHLHVRYCLPRHPDQRYRCSVPDPPSAAERQQLLVAGPNPGNLRPPPLDLRSLRH